ncbi:MAG: hypothetical protein K2R98_13780 [Gemmataceae bacterium]|nr:hypothetical protein [Gemmataceae bacterium]
MGYVEPFLRQLLVWLWTVAFTAGVSGGSATNEKQKNGDSGSRFAGKTLVLLFKDGHASALENVKMRRLGGREYLVGQYVVLTDDSRFAGLTIWAAPEDVMQIQEFENVEQVNKAYPRSAKPLIEPTSYTAPAPPVASPPSPPWQRTYWSPATDVPSAPLAPPALESPGPLPPCIQDQGEPLSLADDVTEMQTRSFGLPVAVDAQRADRIRRIEVFVSEDRGKSWSLHMTCSSKKDVFSFTAQQDGEYWFAVRVILKAGKEALPPDLSDLCPAQKIYVNTAKRLIVRSGT